MIQYKHILALVNNIVYRAKQEVIEGYNNGFILVNNRRLL